MPHLTVTLDGVMERYATQLKQLGTQAPVILTTALLGESPAIQDDLAAALTPQTGLRREVLDRAVKVRPAALSLSFITRGGDIALKYFRPYETAPGVSAAPRNARSVFEGSFMRAGWWPKRVDKPNWNGQVFYRAGGKTKSGMSRFTKAKSGVYIPDEMVKGASLVAWEAAVVRIQAKVETQIAKLLP